MSKRRREREGKAEAAPSRARGVIDAVCERIRGGTPIKNAFALEGVPKRTAYDLMERDESVRDAVDMARAVASERRREMFEASPSAPWLHYMQTLDPENFPKPTDRIENTGKDGGAIEVKHTDAVDKLSDAEVIRAARAILDKGEP
jgi:hypothetical protein